MTPVVRQHRLVQVRKPSTSLLYAWLLVVVIFEYARPAAFISALRAVPLNSLLPLGLLVFCVVASGLRPVKEIWSDRMAWWLTGYLVLISLGVLHADVTLRAYTTFKTCLGYAFLAFMIARICTTRARILGMFATLIAAHLFLLVMNPAVVLNPETRNYVRGATFLGDGNDFSLSVCMLVPMCLAIAFTRKAKATRLFAFGVTILLVLAIVGTSSRGATLGLAGCLMFLVASSNRKTLALAGAGALVLVILAYAPDTYFSRVKTVATYEEDSSATARIAAWKAGARMAASNPVFGVGAGNFPNSFPKYRGPGAPVRWMTAHSVYFLVMGELGVPGIVTLLVLVIGGVIRSLRVLRSPVVPAGIAEQEVEEDLIVLRFLAAAGVAFAIAGAFLSAAYYPHIFVVTALTIAARLHVTGSATLQTSGTLASHATRRKTLKQPPRRRQVLRH